MCVYYDEPPSSSNHFDQCQYGIVALGMQDLVAPLILWKLR